MISLLESPLALTILDSSGTKVRVQRTHPAFEEIRSVLKGSTDPANVKMDRIRAMMADPLESILRWAARMGFPLSRTPSAGMLDVNAWAPFLSRLMKVGSTPDVAIRLARVTSLDAPSFDMGKICALWQPATGRGDASVRLLYLRPLPSSSRVGDVVANLKSVTGPVAGLVATASPWDGASDIAGEVIEVGHGESSLSAVLCEPSILGLNRTYRCEEAGDTGWLVNQSFDSLAAAAENLKEIRSHGVEARVVNRISGEVVNV